MVICVHTGYIQHYKHLACISVHTIRPLKSGHFTNKDTLIIRTLVHGPICISVHTFRPLKSGHLTNKDTLIIRTLVHGPICISVHTFRPLKSGHLDNQDTCPRSYLYYRMQMSCTFPLNHALPHKGLLVQIF